eukprot:862304_1
MMNLLFTLILAIAFLVATDSQGGFCGSVTKYDGSCTGSFNPLGGTCINGLYCNDWWDGKCKIDMSVDCPEDVNYTGCAEQLECCYGYYCDGDHCTPCDWCDAFYSGTRRFPCEA